VQFRSFLVLAIHAKKKCIHTCGDEVFEVLTSLHVLLQCLLTKL
jgi:hypothetical protein